MKWLALFCVFIQVFFLIQLELAGELSHNTVVGGLVVVLMSAVILFHDEHWPARTKALVRLSILLVYLFGVLYLRWELTKNGVYRR